MCGPSSPPLANPAVRLTASALLAMRVRIGRASLIAAMVVVLVLRVTGFFREEGATA